MLSSIWKPLTWKTDSAPNQAKPGRFGPATTEETSMNEQTVRYLANIYDPRNPGAKRQFVRSFYAHASIEEKGT